jgi:hypothetical protein
MTIAIVTPINPADSSGAITKPNAPIASVT